MYSASKNKIHNHIWSQCCDPLSYASIHLTNNPIHIVVVAVVLQVKEIQITITRFAIKNTEPQAVVNDTKKIN